MVTPVADSGKNFFSEEEWYAISNAPLSKDSIVVSLTSETVLLTVLAFAVSGANTSAPFDQSPSLPVRVAGSTQGTISAALSSTCPDDMIIGGASMKTPSPGPGTGPGYTLIQSDDGLSIVQDPAAEYQIVSSVQTDLQVSFTNEFQPFLSTWIVIGDALN